VPGIVMIRARRANGRERAALDAIAGKLGNLTVLNGTEGLMNGLVRLGD